MNKREAELKSSFTAELKRQFPHFLTLRFSTAGAPDRALVGNGVTSYWEFKHANPEFDSPGNQELLCARLAKLVFCRYVLWYEKQGEERTMIVHPNMILHRRGEAAEIWRMGIQAEDWCSGFDHLWLLRYIGEVHKCPKQKS